MTGHRAPGPTKLGLLAGAELEPVEGTCHASARFARKRGIRNLRVFHPNDDGRSSQETLIT